MQHKNILITGAAKRLGAHCARHLHSLGANIVIHCNHSKNSAIQLADELNKSRANSARVICADITDINQLTILAEKAIGCFGRIDVLVNNASTFYAKNFGDYDINDWQSLVGSNMQAPFFLSQHLKKELAKNQGVIINMLDINAQQPLKGYSLYCMAKSALHMMTEVLAAELAPEIRVNGIAPGAILWPEHPIDESTKQKTIAAIPMKGIGHPQDIADAMAYLINAKYVTGHSLTVDGGKRL
ncbi:pteridine reductase [Neptunicella marina]|uniref:Pteridine reductase n=1 Tax=Neptunicella marina TaxID=2125989 RepID=A0A8J6IW02_9ALTE|nr:pteridine reductase [Neptunicella marina]MBC3767309.1 pteridine reductase [Neptunicella marina]